MAQVAASLRVAPPHANLPELWEDPKNRTPTNSGQSAIIVVEYGIVRYIL